MREVMIQVLRGMPAQVRSMVRGRGQRAILAVVVGFNAWAGLRSPHRPILATAGYLAALLAWLAFFAFMGSLFEMDKQAQRDLEKANADYIKVLEDYNAQLVGIVRQFLPDFDDALKERAEREKLAKRPM